MCQFCGCEADPPSKEELIRQGVLDEHKCCVNKTDLRKLVEEWELIDTMQANMTSRDYLIRYSVERTRAIKKLLEGNK